MGKNIDRLNGVNPMEEITQGASKLEQREIPVVEIIRHYIAELSTDDALISSFEWDDHTLDVVVKVGKVTRTLTREGMLLAGQKAE